MKAIYKGDGIHSCIGLSGKKMYNVRLSTGYCNGRNIIRITMDNDWSFSYASIQYFMQDWELIEEESASMMETISERDKRLEELWGELEDIPMDCDTECIEAPFLDFPVGTYREEIWHWFDERHSKGISYLLYGYPFWEKEDKYVDSLEQFVKEEIPFRIVSVLNFDVSKEEIERCIEWFQAHADAMFDFEAIDQKIKELIQQNRAQ